MAAYSMDLRLRVLRDADAGLPSDELAEKYSVSRAWVDRLKQRRRETGEVAPRKQTRWRPRILHAQLTELAALIRERPDRTLAELQEALRTPASLPTLCRTMSQGGSRPVPLVSVAVFTQLLRSFMSCRLGPEPSRSTWPHHHEPSDAHGSVGRVMVPRPIRSRRLFIEGMPKRYGDPALV